MAYMSDGHFQVISGYRMGNSSLYLDEKWTGATFFIKALRTYGLGPERPKRISRLFVVPSKRRECTANFGLDDTHTSSSVH